MLTDLTGKEANKLIERLTGEVVDPAEYRTDYGSRADRCLLVLPVLQRIAGDEGIESLMARSDRGRSAVYEAFARVVRGQKAYLDAAAGYASEQLVDARMTPPAGAYPALYCYVRWLGRAVHERRCALCDNPLPPAMRADAQFCSATCRQRGRRRDLRHE